MVRRQLVGTRRGLIIISTILHQSVLGPGGANCWDASRVDEIVGLNFSLKNPWLQNLRDLMWCAISISKLRLDVKCNARKSFRFFELEWRTSCISNCLIVIFCVAYKPITRIRSFDSCIRSRGRDIRKKPSQAKLAVMREWFALKPNWTTTAYQYHWICISIAAANLTFWNW